MSDKAMRILVVEDDVLLADGIAQLLHDAGHAVEVSASLAGARTQLDLGPPDLLILDIGLPDGDGFDLLRQLRSGGADLCVLVLTARDALDQRVHGLNLGADDYMTKPFANEELLARVAALLRRRSGAFAERRLGPLLIDRAAQRAYLEGQPLDLPRREWDILNLLAGNPERLVRKEQLAASCGSSDSLTPQAVEVYVCRLRAKLETAGVRIRAIRGMGYMLEARRHVV